MTSVDERTERRRRRRRATLTRWLLRVAVALVLFGIGVAVGEALHDNPRPQAPVTLVRTLHAP